MCGITAPKYHIVTTSRRGFRMKTRRVPRLKYFFAKQSIKLKIMQANWIVSQNFGGAMMYDMSSDDPNGNECRNGTYPITRTVKNILNP